VAILEHALAPLAPTLPTAVRDKLHRALSIVYGIEPYIILKDIWGANDREVERIALWMADALIDAAVRDAQVPEAAEGAAAPPSYQAGERARRPAGQRGPEAARALAGQARQAAALATLDPNPNPNPRADSRKTTRAKPRKASA
jgi:hypothetical protein